jgi:vacuolar protein sorting-associated protein 13A/C
MEALAVPLVNQILGEYISNLNSKQLKIGLWDGNVKLENLQLKREMFSQWKIGLDVVYGIQN